MKISIVTISFNQSKYLKECIESVLGQSYKNIEYIVVDPGSTDGSREIIASYGDAIIKVFSKDEGPADGLNNGFSVATGDIFYFLNADDYLEDEAILNVIRFFQDYSDIDVIVGNGYIDSNGQKTPISSDSLEMKSLLLRSCRIFQQGTFFKADIFYKSGGFNKLNSTCWDYELFVNFAKLNAKCLSIKHCLASFRIHNDSISGSGRLNHQYAQDLARIYLETTGRKWGVGPTLLSLISRSRRFIFDRLTQRSI